MTAQTAQDKFMWIDDNDQEFKHLFKNAVNYLQKQDYDKSFDLLFDIVSTARKPNKELAQFFTPLDVALYTAYNLVNDIDICDVVFDPSIGKGDLLIATGLILALKGYKDDDLLNKLQGCEICQYTRDEAIQNIYLALKQYIHIPKEKALAILEQNLVCQDFLQFEFDKAKQYSIITNPPYKEQNSTNLWISFMDKLLREVSIKNIGAILPISVSCSERAKHIREKILYHYNSIQAFHHGIRPQRLFPNAEQNITILVLKNTNKGYHTTGFLTHKAKERLTIWQATYSEIPKAYLTDYFVKPFSDEIAFMQNAIDNPKKIKDITGGDMVEFWVRCSGRYRLAIQQEAPTKTTNKWVKLKASKQQYDYLKQQFDNGNALKWWIIFGDWRDFSIKKFINQFGVGFN